MSKKKSFVQQQVALHNKAMDILQVISACNKKIRAHRRKLEEWDSASTYDIVRLQYPDRIELEYRLQWQRFVLSRLSRYYSATLGALIAPAMDVDSILDTLISKEKQTVKN